LLNENLKKSVGKVSEDSLHKLTGALERFDEEFADSARIKAKKVLRTKNDALLFCTYLRYVISQENSADEEITWDIGELFIENPDIFFKTQCKITDEERNILKKTIEEGLFFWSYKINYSKSRIDSVKKRLDLF
jgi:hypothetical protein